MNNFVHNCYTTLEVCHLLGISVETLRRWVKNGKFPPPVPVKARLNWYNKADVYEFMQKAKTETRA